MIANRGSVSGPRRPDGPCARSSCRRSARRLAEVVRDHAVRLLEQLGAMALAGETRRVRDLRGGAAVIPVGRRGADAVEAASDVERQTAEGVEQAVQARARQAAGGDRRRRGEGRVAPVTSDSRPARPAVSRSPTSRASAAGTNAACPRPSKTRAAISSVGSRTSPVSSNAAVHITAPPTSSARVRPRSASRPSGTATTA